MGNDLLKGQTRRFVCRDSAQRGRALGARGEEGGMMLLGSWFRQRKEERDTKIGKPKKGEKKNRGLERMRGKRRLAKALWRGGSSRKGNTCGGTDRFLPETGTRK